MPSIWPFFSDWTAWSLVSKTAGSSRGLDLVGDGGVARRADLGAQLGVGELGEAGRTVDGAALVGDDGLHHVEVARGEVDGLAAGLGDRDLVEVEVELLRTGLDDLVEGHGHPGDLLGGVAELLGDGVADGGLVALTVGGVVVDEPRLEGRGVGGDREGARGDGLHRVGGALVRGRGLRGVGGVGRRVGAAVGLVGRGAGGEGQRGGRDRGHGEVPHGAGSGGRQHGSNPTTPPRLSGRRDRPWTGRP